MERDSMFWLWNVLATEKIVLLPNGVKDADILFNGEKRRAGLCWWYKRNDMTIDTTNMCSHLQKKLFEPDGVYYPIWQAMKDDETLTAVVRSRQLHIYRNGKKILILAGKAQPKIIREDKQMNW